MKLLVSSQEKTGNTRSLQSVFSITKCSQCLRIKLANQSDRLHLHFWIGGYYFHLLDRTFSIENFKYNGTYYIGLTDCAFRT